MTATERTDFLAKRRKFIGSSDAAAACGISPWSTAYEVYCSKVYGIERPMSEEMRIGTLIEPFIGKLYEWRTGGTLTKPAEPFLDPKYPWRGANLDFVTAKGQPVEAKNVDKFAADEFGEAGTDMVPAHYMIQTQHQIATVLAEQAELAALIGGNDFRLYDIRRSDNLIKRMTDAEEALWGMIERMESPAPDFTHSSTIELMKVLAVPSADAAEVKGTKHHLELATKHVRLGKDISDLEKARKALKAELIDAMGQSSVMSLPNGEYVTRKLVERKGYECKPTSYYDFRIIEKKKK